MKNNILLVVSSLIVIILAYGVFQLLTKPKSLVQEFNPRNASYSVEGTEFNLINGEAEKEIAPNSASKAKVTMWGEYTTGDLNNDKLDDAALLLTYDGGGSGTFYYIAAALRNDKNETFGTNAILLGDRIAPQQVMIENGVIIVNYADRRIDEPMTSQPSIGITRTFALSDGVLKEITSQDAVAQQACIIAGGTVKSSMCCKAVSNFPNNCAIGACGCSPANSHEVKTCDCGSGKCFNGTSCVLVR